MLLPVPSSTQKRSVLDKRNGNIYEEYGGSKVVVEKKDMGRAVGGGTVYISEYSLEVLVILYVIVHM